MNTYPLMPSKADFQECWDALCTLASNEKALLVSHCLTMRVIMGENVSRSSGLVPFSLQMIATYSEFASMFKQALKLYYNDTGSRPENRAHCDIMKGVLFEAHDKTVRKDCTRVKMYYTLEDKCEGGGTLKPLLEAVNNHNECSNKLSCEFYTDKAGHLIHVLFCYAMED